MPPDNASTVGVGEDVDFPQDGPTSGTGITRASASTFNLADIGVYQVSVTEAGQFILTLNGADLAYSVVGRATATSQITGMAPVQTTVINSILTFATPPETPPLWPGPPPIRWWIPWPRCCAADARAVE